MNNWIHFMLLQFRVFSRMSLSSFCCWYEWIPLSLISTNYKTMLFASLQTLSIYLLFRFHSKLRMLSSIWHGTLRNRQLTKVSTQKDKPADQTKRTYDFSEKYTQILHIHTIVLLCSCARIVYKHKTYEHPNETHTHKHKKRENAKNRKMPRSR